MSSYQVWYSYISKPGREEQMPRNQFGQYFMIAILGIMLFMGPTKGMAQELGTTEITSPSADETITGLITVTGTVDFSDFLKYEVLLKSGDQFSWVATVFAPVVNGNLARLDSRLFLNGTYQLVIRRVVGDSSYTDHIGPTITIANEQGAPFPYPLIDSSFLYAPPNHALAHVRNCGHLNMEFDYNSPMSFCSGDDLWIPPRQENSEYCPSVDILLIPNCEYRGTAVGEGEPIGVTYSFQAEKGKIYNIDFPGQGRIFIGEIEGDDPDSSAAPSSPTTKPASTQAKTTLPTTGNVISNDAATGQSEALLPVSGQSETSNLPFIVVATSVILLLVIGGLFATRRNKLTG
jgi:hypothetical protein